MECFLYLQDKGGVIGDLATVGVIKFIDEIWVFVQYTYLLIII